jgi:hypothetical protein
MSSYDNQEGDQFKLISLEGNNAIKPGAQKAKQAYSSYLKDGESSGGTNQLSLNEDDPPPAPPAPVVEKKAVTKPLTKEAPKAAEKPKSVVSKFTKPVEEDDGDYEEDSYGGHMENVSLKIEELKESISALWSNFASAVSAIFLKVSSVLVKPIVIMASITAKILSIPLKATNRVVSSIADKMGVKAKEQQALQAKEEVVEEKPAEIKNSTFSEMIDLNIVFTDNYKKNLFNKPTNAGFKLSKMEEALIMGIAIEAIKECAEFTAELPAPASGIYQGIPISKIMEDVVEEDVQVFLGFVKAFPGKYIGKSWKISETFATWLINNSPTG